MADGELTVIYNPAPLAKIPPIDRIRQSYARANHRKEDRS
jgi:hypothetical protein